MGNNTNTNMEDVNIDYSFSVAYNSELDYFFCLGNPCSYEKCLCNLGLAQDLYWKIKIDGFEINDNCSTNPRPPMNNGKKKEKMEEVLPSSSTQTNFDFNSPGSNNKNNNSDNSYLWDMDFDRFTNQAGSEGEFLVSIDKLNDMA